MVIWPAIIKLTDNDELLYIADLAQWHSDEDLHFIGYEQLDMLIDSAGAIHYLDKCNSDRSLPNPTGEYIELARAIDLVKAHFSSVGACCAAKITARSVADLVDWVGLDNDA